MEMDGQEQVIGQQIMLVRILRKAKGMAGIVMPEEKEMYRARIRGSEDFGLFFNCLTRRYLWDFDEELLNLMIRTADRYLVYFSKRTLICAIRDLACEKDGIFCRRAEGKPDNQKERYGSLLMCMVRRYLSIEAGESTDGQWKNMKVYELASDGGFIGSFWPGKDCMFPSREAFARWVSDNRLDESDRIPVWEGEILPIEAEFLPDFCALCLSCVQYAYSRSSYLPSACREFIWKNSALLPDDGLKRIAEEIDSRLEEEPDCGDTAGKMETSAWKTFSDRLHLELYSRE